MKYDFDKPINRKGTYSYKWDCMDMVFGKSKGIYPMWVADMDFPCAEEIVNAVTERAAHPIYAYSNPGLSFGEPAKHWVEKRHGWKIDASDVILCSGVVPALSACITAFTKENDSILIQQPVYYPFHDVIVNNHRKMISSDLVYSEITHRWEIDFDDFARKAANVKMFIMCNPHNPVGRVFTKEELERIGEICLAHHVLIVSDEIHSDLVYKPNKHIPIASVSPALSQNTVTCISPSKGFNIAGLQIACAITGNKELHATLTTEFNKSQHVTNLFGTVAYMTAYEQCEDYIDELVAYLWNNYLYVDDFFKNEMPKLKCQRPEATYLLWVDCSDTNLCGEEINDFFLNEANIAIDNGIMFGNPGRHFARLNIATSKETLKEALFGLKNAYDARHF